MPVSAQHHRTSSGTYHNKLHDNDKRNAPLTKGRSVNHAAILNETDHFGSTINRVVHSHHELNRRSYQNTVPRQGILAPLLMLLCQFRLVGTQLPATTDSPTWVTDRDVSLSVSRNIAPAETGRHGCSAILNPVVNALYETGQFIARHDPLRFPTADASPMSLVGEKSTMAADITWDFKSDSYIITGEQKKKALISSLVQYLVSDGQVTAEESKHIEWRLRSEAAGMPIVATRLDNREIESNRTTRALIAERDPRTGEHIRTHCAFEEEVLDTQGENKGRVLLFQAQRAENPFRMIYDNKPNYIPSQGERWIADGFNILFDFLTLGVKPLIGKLIANAKRREYYQNLRDDICAERFRQLFIAELATSMSIDGLPFRLRGGGGRVKPSELLHVLPEHDRAAFYTRDPHSGIRKEILLELEPKTINTNEQKVYLKPTEEPNEFVTYLPDAENPALLERKVRVDEDNLSWRYADSFDADHLNVDIREGRRQITLHGEYYELHQNGAGKYEVVLNKYSGVKEFVPVYMEPLSRTWHLSTHNTRPVFNKKQIDLIVRMKSTKEEGFYYRPKLNENKHYYGNGNLFEQVKIGDATNKPCGHYIEMNGDMVPVRNAQHRGKGVLYEVYDVKKPFRKGHLVEWDGCRWLFERKTSVHVSKLLKKTIDPSLFSGKVDAGRLSTADHQGLRYDANGHGYIKILGVHIRVGQHGKNYYLKDKRGGKFYIEIRNDQFYPDDFSNHIMRLKKTI